MRKFVSFFSFLFLFSYSFEVLGWDSSVSVGPVFFQGVGKASGREELFSGSPGGWGGWLNLNSQVGDWNVAFEGQWLSLEGSGDMAVNDFSYEGDTQVRTLGGLRRVSVPISIPKGAFVGTSKYSQQMISPRLTLSKPVWKNSFVLVEPSLSLVGGYARVSRQASLKSITWDKTLVPEQGRGQVWKEAQTRYNQDWVQELGWVQPVLGLRAVVFLSPSLHLWGYGGLGGLGWGGVEEGWEWSTGVKWSPVRQENWDLGIEAGCRGQSFFYERSASSLSQDWYAPFLGVNVGF